MKRVWKRILAVVTTAALVAMSFVAAPAETVKAAAIFFHPIVDQQLSVLELIPTEWRDLPDIARI